MDLSPPMRKRLGNALLHWVYSSYARMLVLYISQKRESIGGTHHIQGAPYGTPYTFIRSGNTIFNDCTYAVHEAHMLTNLVAG
jgi:hypothetical protein